VETIPPPAARFGRWKMELDPECIYLINPGSVGQPRDHDPRAAFAIYDTEARVVEYRRVSYDVAAAQRKIIEAGLPAILADRLALGR
jgi:diadenosine tetraphosphatase ApaH/serine/threonine PP2A family protein phosphatase